MDMEEWKMQTEGLLSELREIDFGYPLGDNGILNPSADENSMSRIEEKLGSRVASSLRCFYQVCDGLSWPDVQSGYFIKKAESVGVIRDKFEVTQIQGKYDYGVVVVGSSGNGVLFALDASERVLKLPPGKIENNTYSDLDDKIIVLTNRFIDFLHLLTRDLKAFVEDTQDYQYIA